MVEHAEVSARSLRNPGHRQLAGRSRERWLQYDSSGRLLPEAKEDMRKRGVPSPDEADAMALCFSEPEGTPFPRSNGFNRQIEYPGLRADGAQSRGLACDSFWPNT